MAISFIGSATGTNTATMPAHVAGDLLIVFAGRSATGGISSGGGWTGLSNLVGSISRMVAYKFAASSSEVVGTWAGADLLAVHVYRGVAAIGSIVDASINTAATISYGATPLQNVSTSWLAGYGFALSTTSNIDTPPTGLTAVAQALSASSELGTFHSGGVFSGDWPSRSVSLGSSVNRFGYIVELVATPRSISSNGGTYATSGANTPIIRQSNISFVGAANGTNTVALPAHQEGDLIILAAWNTGNTSSIATVSGYTSVFGSTAGGSRYRKLMYKIAESSSETIPAMGNCTICAASVYRGTRQGEAVGTPAVNSTTTSTATYNQVSLTASLDAPSSWVGLVGIAYASSSSPIETPPSGCVNRTNGIVSSSEIAFHDTNGGVGVFAAKSVSLGVSTARDTMAFEILSPFNIVMSTDPGSYAISGADAAVVRSYTVTADPGSYMLSGADTPFIQSLLISADPGSYAISGANSTIDVGRYIIADPGSYAISGANTALVRSLLMSADPGSYSLSGAATGVFRSLVVSPAPGAYVLGGADTSLEKGYVISAEAGSYSINGADTSLIRALEIVAAPGAYMLGGSDTAIYRGYAVIADAGSYTISGVDVALQVELKGLPINVWRGDEWVLGRLMVYRDGDWVKPTVKRYHDGDWEEL